MGGSQRRDALVRAARATVGFLPEDEADALVRAGARAGASGLGPLVEVGAYRGRSTLFLAAALAGCGVDPPPLLYSVDHHHGSEEMQAGWPDHDPSVVDPRTGAMDTLPFWRRAIEDARAGDLVAAVVGDSVRVAASWATPLSLCLLDGGHGAAIAWADYRGWSRHVAPGGLLVIHDVFPDPADGGRPPYECFLDATSSETFTEEVASSCGSLRVLRRAR